jgi:WD40 repeat protein/serine/threonine protein kinase
VGAEPDRLKREILDHLEAQEWPAALALLEGWCDHVPTDARAWVNRGYCLMRLGRFAESMDALDHSLALEPGLDKARELRRWVEHQIQAPSAASAASMAVQRPDQTPESSRGGQRSSGRGAATVVSTARWRSTRLGTHATYGSRPTAEAERVWRERSIIAGRYEVVEAMRGGMGIVYIVYDRELERTVAVKTPLPSVLASDEGRARFHREAEAWISLGMHPNICTALYVQEIGGMPRLFIEYVDGGDLEGLLVRNPDLSMVDRLDISAQIAGGIAYTHDFEWIDDDDVHHCGLVHRDLKPANVLMTKDGAARVTDFGLVRSKAALEVARGGSSPSDLGRTAADRPFPDDGLTGGSWQTVTHAGGVLGTPPYLAPELWQTSGRASPASDIYAFGCMLYEVFCRRRPFSVASEDRSAARSAQLAEWMRLHKGEPPPDPRCWANELDEDLADLMTACIAKRPEQRPASFADIRTRLIDIYRRVADAPYPRPEPRRTRLLADSLNNRAVSYMTLGNALRASKGLDEALGVDPNHLEATYNRCLIEWRSKGLTDAEMVRRLAEAVRSAADSPRSRHLLGKLYLLLDDAGAAVAELRSASENGGGSLDLRRDLGCALLAAARSSGDVDLYRQAIQQLGEVVATSGSELGSLVGCAEAHLAAGEEQSANEAWRRAKAQSPDLPDDLGQAAALLLPGHGASGALRQAEAIQRLALLGDDRLASRDASGAITVWDLVSRRKVAVLKTKSGDRRGRSIAAVPGTQQLVVTFTDQPIGIWNLSNGEMIRRFKTHPGQPTCVAVSADGSTVVTGGSDRRLRVWDAATGDCRFDLEGHEAFVTDVGVDGSGRWVLSASGDGTLGIWSVDQRTRRVCLKGHDGAVNVIDWVPQEGLVVSGGADGTVRVWDVSTGAPLRTMVGHGAAVTAVSVVGGDTRIVVSGSDDRTFRFWDLETGAPLRLIRLPQGVSDLQLPGGGTKVLAAHGTTVTVYDLPHDVAVRLPLALTEPVDVGELDAREARFRESIALAGTLLARGDFEGAIQPLREARRIEGYGRRAEFLEMWGQVLAHFPKGSIRGHAELRQFEGHQGAVSAVALMSDMHHVVSGGADGTLRTWRLDSARQLREFGGHAAPVTGLAVADDVGRLLSSARDGTMRLWDIASGECIREMSSDGGALNGIAFLPDGLSWVAAGEDGRLVVWRNELTAPAEVVGEHGESVSALAVSDDGRFAVSGGWDHEVVVWSVARRTQLQRLTGHEGAISAVAVSPDCRMVASAGEDGVIRVWHRSGERCWRTLKGHEGSVQTIVFSPDARFLLSGGKDSTLRVWDLRTGTNVQRVEGHTGTVAAVAFDRDGQCLLSGGADATIRHWSLEWEPDIPDGERWDDRVRPFLEVFLRLRQDAQGVVDRPCWSDAEFDALWHDLSRRGFGWLDRERVLRELERLVSGWAESRGQEQRVVHELAQRQKRRQLVAPLRQTAEALFQNLSYRLIAVVLAAIAVPLAIMSVRSPEPENGIFNRTLFHELDLAFQKRVTRLHKGTVLAYQGGGRTVLVGSEAGCSVASFPDYLDVMLDPQRHTSLAANPATMVPDEVFRVRYHQAVLCLGEVGGKRAVRPILDGARIDLHPTRVEDWLSVLVRVGDDGSREAMRALSSSSEPTRHLAAMSLVYRQQPQAWGPLVAALDGDDRRSVEAASHVLTELVLVGAVPQAEAFTTVKRLSRSIDPRVRRNAVRALVLFERRGAMRDLLDEALQDADPGVAATARWVDESLRAATAQKYFGIDLES